MWIIATEDLTEFLPENGRTGRKSQMDVSSTGLPRLFTNKTSARIALGLWLVGPFFGEYEEDWGWIANQQTDPARVAVWKGKLDAREVKVVAA